ncbi:P-type conjugative transfer protein TrbJ [Bartonella alsatica]|uniref:P-type conjugative transfer protein TrbJ n=2 Tax=Bartonella alsatica TaxID=52764 RepID=J0Q142_9HYPH|nr:P-type conjugative transfer protein TrbJ [Bartonella alsatica]EJF76259.1 P-type conjugative transfer protein TrbJ [Bartonella alsatica IBS 382]QLC51796.1 P-type conjugative transfer protein TrbJ [Bartonella alsatica]
MSNILKKLKFISIITTFFITNFVVLIIPQQAIAQIICTNCSTVFTQVLEYAKAVETAINTAEQVAVEIKQYKDMIEQAKKLDPISVERFENDLKLLNKTYQDAKIIAYNMQNLHNKFKERYPGYENFLKKIGKENPIKDFRKWAETGFANARIAIQAAGINISSFVNEDNFLRRLLNRSATAKGRMQAIQAGNEIATQQVKQLQMLRELVANNITLQANYTADEVERKAKNEANVEKFFETKLPSTDRGHTF